MSKAAASLRIDNTSQTPHESAPSGRVISTRHRILRDRRRPSYDRGSAGKSFSDVVTKPSVDVVRGGLDDPRVQAVLEYHVTTARAETARGSAHALDLDALKSSDITFWSAWDGEAVLGVGALKRLSAAHGEIKSMHTAEAHRGAGVGSTILTHIIEFARLAGMTRLSLETGSWDYFKAARAFYKQHDFVECAPFGDYTADPNSVFMTLDLTLVGKT
jgi:putative acetyltransferase